MNQISIIMPCFNAEKYIREAIDSVRRQSYAYWELIIIDDASSDQSVDIIRNAIRSDRRIKLIQNPSNVGAGMTRNVGLDQMTGDYFTFLDADDVWYPEKLQKQLDYMQSNDVAFTFGGYDFLNSDGIKVGAFEPNVEKVDYQYLLTNGVIACHTVMIDRKRIATLPRFPNLKMRQDYVFWLKLLKKETEFAYCLPGDPLVGYRLNKKSLSSNKIQALKSNYRVYRDFENFSVLKSILILWQYSLHYFQKRMWIRLKAKFFSS